jgi:hypothetical protein
MQRYRFVFILVGMVFCLLGCIFTPPKAEKNSYLVTVEYTGGLCTYGPCYDRTAIYRDGLFVNSDGSGARTSNKLDQATVDELVAIIEASDFEELKTIEFTGECPTAHDGQEIIYTFYLDDRTETLSTCQYVIDYETPLFHELDRVLPMFGTPAPPRLPTNTPLPTLTPTPAPCNHEPRVAIQTSAESIRVGETLTISVHIIDIGEPYIYLESSSGAGATIEYGFPPQATEIHSDDVFEILEADSSHFVLQGKAPGSADVTVRASGENWECMSTGLVFTWGAVASNVIHLEVVP